MSLFGMVMVHFKKLNNFKCHMQRISATLRDNNLLNTLGIHSLIPNYLLQNQAQNHVQEARLSLFLGELNILYDC